MKKSVVTSSPGIMGGTPVFAGTRVPVETLFGYLEEGLSIDDFLKGYPGVKRKQVVAVLDRANSRCLRA